MIEIDALHAYFEKHRERFLEEYFEYLRFQSFSADPKYRPVLEETASWWVEKLKPLDLDVEIWETGGGPVVFAQSKTFDSSKTTALLYGHYDVQPVDPIELWDSDPFEPVIRDGKVFARGASDNKGQSFYTFLALRALLDLRGDFPVNIKLLIEGEEESGSPGLARILPEKKEKLKSDHLLIIDSGFDRFDEPCVSIGARGLVTMTLTLTGSAHDLHSGEHGGVVYNPNRAMVELLASLRDAKGRILVPGFHDAIQPLSISEKEMLHLDFCHEDYHATFKAHAVGMEEGVHPQEACWLRPTVEINGLKGGYGGEGFKTVIPAQSVAKISCRLVPDQDPIEIASLVERFLTDQLPEGIEMTMEVHPGVGRAVFGSPESLVSQAFQQGYSDVFKTPCRIRAMGGSVPITFELTRASGADLLLIGVALGSDQIHSPNEHFAVKGLEFGLSTLAHSLELLGKN